MFFVHPETHVKPISAQTLRSEDTCRTGHGLSQSLVQHSGRAAYLKALRSVRNQKGIGRIKKEDISRELEKTDKTGDTCLIDIEEIVKSVKGITKTRQQVIDHIL